MDRKDKSLKGKTVLLFLIRSRLNAAIPDVRELGIGRRSKDVETWTLKAGRTSAAAIRFAFASATALAAGFLLSLGLDAMALIGKWEILLAMAFYTGVVWALVSPVLLIPQSVSTLAQVVDQANQRNAADVQQNREREQKAERERLDHEIAIAKREHSASRSYMPDLFRSEVAIEKERAAAAVLKQKTDERDKLAGPMTTLEAEARASLGVRTLASLSRLLYIVVIGAIGWLVIGPIHGLTIAFLSLLVLLLARHVGAEAALPLATALILILGFSLGERFKSLPLSARIQLDGEQQPLQARIIASTATELIVLAEPRDGTRRSVMMIPRNVVRRVIIEPDNGAIKLHDLLPNTWRTWLPQP